MYVMLNKSSKKFSPEENFPCRITSSILHRNIKTKKKTKFFFFGHTQGTLLLASSLNCKEWGKKDESS